MTEPELGAWVPRPTVGESDPGRIESVLTGTSQEQPLTSDSEQDTGQPLQSITAICIARRGANAAQLTSHRIPPHNAVHMSRLEAYLLFFDDS